MKVLRILEVPDVFTPPCSHSTYLQEHSVILLCINNKLVGFDIITWSSAVPHTAVMPHNSISHLVHVAYLKQWSAIGHFLAHCNTIMGKQIANKLTVHCSQWYSLLILMSGRSTFNPYFKLWFGHSARSLHTQVYTEAMTIKLLKSLTTRSILKP